MIYEIVANGISLDAVKESMGDGIAAATKIPGVLRISARNYGGKLGKYKINLSELV